MPTQPIEKNGIAMMITAIRVSGIQARISTGNSDLLLSEKIIEFRKMKYPGIETLAINQEIMKTSAEMYYNNIYFGEYGIIYFFSSLTNLCRFSLSVLDALSSGKIIPSQAGNIFNEWKKTITDQSYQLSLLIAQCQAEKNIIYTTLETYKEVVTDLQKYLKKDINDHMVRIEKISETITQNISNIAEESLAKTGKALQLVSSVITALPMEQVVTSTALIASEFAVSMLTLATETDSNLNDISSKTLGENNNLLAIEYNALSQEEQLLSISIAIMTHARLYDTSMAALLDGLSAASDAFSKILSDIKSLEISLTSNPENLATVIPRENEKWVSLNSTTSAFI